MRARFLGEVVHAMAERAPGVPYRLSATSGACWYRVAVILPRSVTPHDFELALAAVAPLRSRNFRLVVEAFETVVVEIERPLLERAWSDVKAYFRRIVRRIAWRLRGSPRIQLPPGRVVKPSEWISTDVELSPIDPPTGLDEEER